MSNSSPRLSSKNKSDEAKKLGNVRRGPNSLDRVRMNYESWIGETFLRYDTQCSDRLELLGLIQHDSNRCNMSQMNSMLLV